jgi:glycosyltransferase involved in cell wall biosynthesis
MRRIVYVSWPARIMAGGIKMAFRHVEALRELGFDAVLASIEPQPPTWFESTAPLLPLTELVRGTDVLVFPENYTLLAEYTAWPNRKVVFCQNQYKVPIGLAGRQDYADYGVRHLICPGQVIAAYCRRRFPTQELFIVPNYIDASVFFPQEPKKAQIALSPGKRPVEADFVQDLFRSDNPNFAGLPWVRIAGVGEAEVARILRESALYLSLARFEAFGLSTLEAMASGCLVAGFTGFGGQDYATACNGFWAAEDDCLECADRLTLAARLLFEGGQRQQQMIAAARATARSYDRARFLEALGACWRCLLEA